MGFERRRTPRYPIIADAEVTEIASETKLRAKTSDLSLGGCFLDMLNPAPEGTEIAVRISYAETTFTARGKVVFVFPNMGMGVMFTSVPASQQAVLEKWLAKLSAEG
jgi:c-di-GMP-binding flagellar brake protein YcgR